MLDGMTNVKASEVLKELKVYTEDLPHYSSDEVVEALEMGSKSLEQTRWIPVSERLPEEGEPILFSTKTGRVYEGAYFDLIDNRQWYAYKDENYAWNNVVTAWMPLPEPYKEVDADDNREM